jgi:hypothetical protein
MIQFIAKEDSSPGKDYDLVERRWLRPFGRRSKAAPGDLA